MLTKKGYKLDWTHKSNNAKSNNTKKQRESKITTFRFFDLDRNCHETRDLRRIPVRCGGVGVPGVLYRL